MHRDRSDSDIHHPNAAAFRDAVREEDPEDWGPRTSPTTSSAPPATTRPVAGDASAATYVPPRRSEAGTTTTTTERVARPALDAEAPVDRPTFSLGATFLGWAVAAFFTVIFSAVALTFAGGAEVQDGTIDVNNLAITSLIGYLVAAFLAYLIGGYAAGRISLWNGVWHGLGTVAWAVVFGVLAVVAGTYFADALGLSLGLRFDLSGLTGLGLVAIALSLLAMLAGAALGGRLGERYHEVARTASWRRREVGRRRGRPL